MYLGRRQVGVWLGRQVWYGIEVPDSKLGIAVEQKKFATLHQVREYNDNLVLGSQAFYLRPNAGGFQIWKCCMILSWEETAVLYL